MYDLFSSLKCKHCPYQSKSIFATSALVFTRRTDLSSFQRSHWSPIHILLKFSIRFSFPLFSFWICKSSLWTTLRTRFWHASFIDNNLNTHAQRSSSTEVVWIRKIFGGNYCMTGLNSRYLFPPLLYSNASWKTNFIAFFKCFNKFKWFYY